MYQCQASRRHASQPSTPVSCRSDSWPSSRPKLEASPRSSQQPMDWPATQGQQHANSWPVEKIHQTWSYGSDATVLDDYTLSTTTTNAQISGTVVTQQLPSININHHVTNYHQLIPPLHEWLSTSDPDHVLHRYVTGLRAKFCHRMSRHFGDRKHTLDDSII